MLQEFESQRNCNVLGFDLRRPICVNIEWSSDRIQKYAINRNADRLLSVDTSSSPSLFNFQRKGVRCFDLCNINGFSLWDTKDDLMADYQMFKDTFSAEDEVVLVQIAKLDSNCDKTSLDSYSQKEGYNYAGLDIADEGLISALTNCALEEREKNTSNYENLKKSINNSHLIENLSDAIQFCQTFNDWIPEHSPFYIYCLHWTNWVL